MFGFFASCPMRSTLSHVELEVEIRRLAEQAGRLHPRSCNFSEPRGMTLNVPFCSSWSIPRLIQPPKLLGCMEERVGVRTPTCIETVRTVQHAEYPRGSKVALACMQMLEFTTAVRCFSCIPLSFFDVDKFPPVRFQVTFTIFKVWLRNSLAITPSNQTRM